MLGSRITENVRHAGAASVVNLVSMLVVSAASWASEHAEHGHETWGAMLTPQHVLSLLGVLGSVVVAWLSKSPVKEITKVLSS